MKHVNLSSIATLNQKHVQVNDATYHKHLYSMKLRQSYIPKSCSDQRRHIINLIKWHIYKMIQPGFLLTQPFHLLHGCQVLNNTKLRINDATSKLYNVNPTIVTSIVVFVMFNVLCNFGQKYLSTWKLYNVNPTIVTSIDALMILPHKQTTRTPKAKEGL
jgi:hypothetical protein